MGQRSQIYVYWNLGGYQGFIARYFQNNYGEGMVSRCIALMQALKDRLDGSPAQLNFDYETIVQYGDVDFDKQSIANSTDILAEVRDDWGGDMRHLFDQDNNNGQLLIEITLNAVGKPHFAYAFIDPEDPNHRPMDAKKYLVCGLDGASPTEEEIAEKLDDLEYYTIEHIEALRANAQLMTPEHVRAFLDRDYSKFLVSPTWEGVKATRKHLSPARALYKHLCEHLPPTGDKGITAEFLTDGQKVYSTNMESATTLVNLLDDLGAMAVYGCDTKRDPKTGTPTETAGLWYVNIV